jgi:uncharacterized YigZ family protein
VAVPATGENDLREALVAVKKEYPAARHYCYAWRLGAAGQRTRANDDGEPSGTAGKPILGQIISAGLTDVGVIVVRYFGGTLLGTGGLINAYRTASALALAAANIERRFIMCRFCAVFPPEDMSAVLRLLRSSDGEILENQYFAQHELVFRVKKVHVAELRRKFADLYRVSLNELSS